MTNNVYFSFNEMKSKEVVLYLLDSFNHCSVETITEIIYSIDIHHLINFGRPITGNSFIKTDGSLKSPTLTRIFELLLLDNAITITKKYEVYGNKQPDLFELSISDIKSMNLIIEMQKNNENPFKDKAWANTKTGYVISIDSILDSIGDPLLTDYLKNKN